MNPNPSDEQLQVWNQRGSLSFTAGTERIQLMKHIQRKQGESEDDEVAFFLS